MKKTKKRKATKKTEYWTNIYDIGNNEIVCQGNTFGSKEDAGANIPATLPTGWTYLDTVLIYKR